MLAPPTCLIPWALRAQPTTAPHPPVPPARRNPRRPPCCVGSSPTAPGHRDNERYAHDPPAARIGQNLRRAPHQPGRRPPRATLSNRPGPRPHRRALGHGTRHPLRLRARHRPAATTPSSTSSKNSAPAPPPPHDAPSRHPELPLCLPRYPGDPSSPTHPTACSAPGESVGPVSHTTQPSQLPNVRLLRRGHRPLPVVIPVTTVDPSCVGPRPARLPRNFPRRGHPRSW